ncbi:tail protein X [Maricurvus nonylphenolicus]|uniref:tail protein X n=1 Tax=Maricurvus nonylphenolicus TaxID=1008307 RepID=UPI0036F22FEA
MRTVTAQQGDTVDLICHRHLRQTQGVTETVLKLNPGLADMGPIIPMGTSVVLPEETPQPTTNTINLWD